MKTHEEKPFVIFVTFVVRMDFVVAVSEKYDS
jgi:hypothetical protein